VSARRRDDDFVRREEVGERGTKPLGTNSEEQMANLAYPAAHRNWQRSPKNPFRRNSQGAPLYMRSRGKGLCLLLSACFIAISATVASAQTGTCSFQPLNIPAPASGGIPLALNDAGAIVGQFIDSHNAGHGYLLFQGRLSTFKFPGSVSTSAFDISRN